MTIATNWVEMLWTNDTHWTHKSYGTVWPSQSKPWTAKTKRWFHDLKHIPFWEMPLYSTTSAFTVPNPDDWWFLPLHTKVYLDTHRSNRCCHHSMRASNIFTCFHISLWVGLDINDTTKLNICCSQYQPLTNLLTIGHWSLTIVNLFTNHHQPLTSLLIITNHHHWSLTITFNSYRPLAVGNVPSYAVWIPCLRMPLVPHRHHRHRTGAHDAHDAEITALEIHMDFTMAVFTEMIGES